MNPNELELQRRFEERFKDLPAVVQNAITSADVEQHLREMATRHKLHVDQWDVLENEVKLTLYGFQPAEELAHNLKATMDIDDATAGSLAADITQIVFEPIRQELERQLSHPDAVAKVETGVEQMRSQVLAQEHAESAAQVPQSAPLQPAPTTPTPAPVQPAPIQAESAAPSPAVPTSTESTPTNTQPAQPGAAPVPTTEAAPQVVREPISETYKPGISSTERKTVHDDPYREPPL